jgi:hypothetical protein
MTDGRFRQSAFDADETDALKAIGWRPNADRSDCPDPALLLAAEEGVLEDAALGARIRVHAESCPSCRMLVADLPAVLGEEPSEAERARIAARVKTGRPAAVPRRALWWLGALGVAATAALVWIVLRPGDALPPPQPVTQIARQTSSVPSVFVVDRPAIPPGDVDLTVRGEGATPVSLPNQIAAALDKADAGNVAGASADLEGIARRNSNSRSAALALGAVHLRAGRNADAVTTLERARSLTTDRDLINETDWFLGIALVRTRDARARAVLEDLCKRGGARSASACAGVAELTR